MKKTLRYLTSGIATLIGIAALAVPTFAQDPSPQDEECAKIYENFGKVRKTDETQARKYAQEYLDKCKGKAADIDDYLTKWVTKYDWIKLNQDFNTAFEKDDFATLYSKGKQILDTTPDAMANLITLKVANGNENVDATLKMGYAGYQAEKAKNTSYRNDAVNYAKTAIQMLESGKAPNSWWKFKGKDDALAWLNFGIGFMWREAMPKDAAVYFYKSSMYESTIKSFPSIYIFIANFYESQYRKQTAENDKKFPPGSPESPESKAADELAFAWMDRWADALARAIKLASPQEPNKKAWTETLTQIFKARYNTEEGVAEYINTVQSKPLPDPTTEPKPMPVREVKVDAATTTDTKPTTITSTPTTSDVAMTNGNGTTPKTNSTATKGTTATAGATTTPAKKAPAKKGGKKKPK
jgi:hypothetical protein